MTRSEPSTALATLEGLDRRRFNVLAPIISVEGDAVSPVLVQSVQYVQINPNEDAGEIYHDYVYAPKNRGKAALTQLGLAKIAAAVGVQWEQSAISDRERRPNGHVYVHVEAVGAIRQPNGELYRIRAGKSLDTEDYAEQRYASYVKKGEKSADEIAAAVRRDVLSFREHVDQRAETGAQNRVIRKLLSIPQVFDVRDLERPFAVPRLLFRPEYAQALEQGSRAADSLYGSGAALPAASAPVAPAGDSSSEGRPSETVPADEPEAAKPARQRKAKAAEPEAATEAGDPPDDPVIEGGPHAGDRFSFVAETDPKYLEQLIGEEGPRSRPGILAQSWLDYTRPQLEAGK